MKMKKLAAALTALCLVAAAGCSAAKQENQSTKVTQASDVLVNMEQAKKSKYVIDGSTAIKEDFNYFGMAMESGSDDLALSDLCCMFPDEDAVYVYFQIPQDTERVAYRVSKMVIDGKDCELEKLDVDGYYQKYVIKGFTQSEVGEYKVTEVNFYNEKQPDQASTYNMSQLVTMKVDEKAFTFNQEYEYSITLAGENFESIYQFNKNNNGFVDLWSNLIGDTDQLNLDKRSFFYFAFNCYDAERKIHFVPDDILQLDVEYTRLEYEYKGKDKDAAENIVPVSKELTQSITGEPVAVTASNTKRSNGRAYNFKTINRLSEADLTKNCYDDAENAEILRQAAKEYDWAVQFGNPQGYEYVVDADASGFFGINPTFDRRYTHIEHFNAIHVVYVYEGKRCKSDTNALIANTTTQAIESTQTPTPTEKKDTELVIIDNNAKLNPLQKLLKKLGIEVKWAAKPLIPWLIVAGVALLLLIGLYFKLGFYRHKRKHGKHKSNAEVTAEEVRQAIEDLIDKK